MTPKAIALAGFLLMGVLGGVLEVVFENATPTIKIWTEFIPIVMGLAFIFMWLHHDGVEVGYRRSPLFNIGIAALGFVFIPIYLYRSRPGGQRARTIFLSVGVLLLYIAAGLLGFYGTRAST